MTSYKLLATAAMGLESIVANEVKELGYETTTDNGKVFFEGTARDIAKTNLWLRTADRVKLIAGEFEATTFDELFEQTKAIEWEKYLPVDAEFPVQGKSVKSKLHSVPTCQSIVKKAIVERMKKAYHRNAFLDESGPRFKIEVSILKDKVQLSIDTSGAGLHKRGYRVGQGEAPLKETLAAALIKLSRWSPDRPFVDPFCGSGTIVIEAAMIGQNIAPGYNREFDSEQWPWIGSKIWDEVRAEAEEQADYDQPLNILGTDIDHRMIQIAEENVIEAGFAGIVRLQQRQVTDFTTTEENGVVIGNPPYGERIGEVEVIEEMIGDMGQMFSKYPTWSVYMLSSMEGFEKLYGQKATKKRKLYNGFIRTDLFQFWGERPKNK
ncbi:class I SAM-dependent RNA methyltransferase [Planococcus sp. CP5-4]|uniref:THUMP domain-containing class I SAM-dependent RNA methyltransferase n=1 Tax=unclassified Planococcus (in: firmicutes) TaxID=2662419 RepID=UPI001C24CA3D|nr:MULTISPECIES: class I SAM-dependent RNA methyltransferase [unclassified Planococcus (in: firmicutes)]MBU9671928.1 class I SAM-dependent RNA methyltransferase [Planococcus sp. CP5-4_YE]MBV0907491.1 class I SAM-dependent RNA methyltransferase [Planococcus sp. CP5-4_UN]MBW6062658.1 class I SAM-dependent RNA methyltransferase [Planococcus sp. CP5-4]